MKPQTFTMIAGPTANAFDVRTSSLPVPRFGPSTTKATVFEILNIKYYLFNDLDDPTTLKIVYMTTSPTRTANEAATQAKINTDIQDGRTFGAYLQAQRSFGTPATVVQSRYPVEFNLTDQNGNGYLVATDDLTITAGSVAGTATSRVIAKLTYRLVDVGIREYIGIVQSQQ